MAIQGDGKIVAVGSRGPVCGDFALARYNPNGSLDTSFSGDGKQTTNFGDAAQGATGVAIQGDGKIIAVGSGGPDLGDFALARYNPNGIARHELLRRRQADDRLRRFRRGERGGAPGQQGRIGRQRQPRWNGGANFALARYNPNGSLDTTFSGDGKQMTDVGDVANGVALQGDGKIVAAGRGAGGGGYAFALARYNPNGSLDTSFSGDGKQTTDFGFPNQIGGARGVALQGDGKIVAVGVGQGPTQTDDFALARYLGG